MILTEHEQKKIEQMCVNTMKVSAQFSQGGIFGSTGGGFAQQLVELRRAIASLDSMKATGDSPKLAMALQRFEAALQAAVTLSGGQQPGALAGYINPREIEGVLAAIDEIRKKHNLTVAEKDNKTFVPEGEERQSMSSAGVVLAFVGMFLFFIVFLLYPFIADVIAD